MFDVLLSFKSNKKNKINTKKVEIKSRRIVVHNWNYCLRLNSESGHSLNIELKIVSEFIGNFDLCMFPH